MPEIKHTFTGGKMNKDLDERIIPNGEYRDAMNVQVSTSEGADVGTVQNILGNSKVPEQEFLANLTITCVGSIADEKNDKLYWMLAGTNWGSIEFNIMQLLDSDPLRRVRVDRKDMILEYDNTNNIVTPVVIDIYSISIPLSTGFSASPNPSQPSILNTIIDSSGIVKGMILEGYDAQGTVIYSATVIDIVGTNVVLSEDIANIFFNIEWFVFSKDRVLYFNPLNTITGINIIDDFLLWTDNNHEPKKINIQRSIDGTQYTTTSTRLIAPENNTTLADDILLEESHITVIRKSPKLAPTIEYNTGRDLDLTYAGVIRIIDTPVSSAIFQGDLWGSSIGIIHDFSGLSIGDWFRIKVPEDIQGNINPTLEWVVGSKVVLKEYDNGSQPGVPLINYVIKGVIKEVYAATSPYQRFRIEITSIIGFPPIVPAGETELKYVIDLFDETEKLFEFKFPRFAYRYRYEDGEYSTYSPFTSVAFEPGSYDYHLTKGYNLGMTNRLVSLKIKNFITNDIPKDVVAIDLLYKEESSPNVYLIDTIKPTSVDNYWLNNEYEVKSDTIQSSTLPSNQLLRPWDNVPIKALSQDIIGNRVIYGNYEQNYDLNTDNHDNYSPIFVEPEITSIESFPSDPVKSIKSLREYQLGVVFVDEHGRETPVLSSNTGTFKVDKSYSNTANRVEVSLDGTEFPTEMKYFKFFIKETSGEYYNLAMGRWYDAADGNIWLTFASTDRNKVDIDTFLILKKGRDSNDLIEDQARYNILAIENEAPDYVKTTRSLIVEETNEDAATGNVGDIFGNAYDINVQPKTGGKAFKMSYDPFDGNSGGNLDEVEGELYVEFLIANKNKISKRYKVSNIEKDVPTNTSEYIVNIDGKFKDDVDFITNTGDASGTHIAFDAQVRFYKYLVENKPEFDGRFFVKIFNDNVFKQRVINSPGDTAQEYDAVASRKIYYMDSVLSNDDFNSDTETGAWRSLAISSSSWNGNYSDYRANYFYFFNNSNGPWDSTAKDKWNDYWFIDNSGSQGKAPTNKLGGALTNWDDIGNTSWGNMKPVEHGGDQDYGVNNSDLKVANDPYSNKEASIGMQHDSANEWSKMDLSFGGIQGKWDHNTEETGGSTSFPTTIWEYEKWDLSSGQNTFFDIGSASGNQNHKDQEGFVENISPSTLVRWKDDPNTENVYRVKSGVEYKQKVKHTIDHRYENDNSALAITLSINNEKYYDKGEPYKSRDNFVKSYVTTVEPEFKWDPTKAHSDGKMQDGEEIIVAVTSIPIITAGGNPYNCYITNLNTISGSIKDIRVGMALQKYVNTSGAQVLTEILVVTEISGNTGAFTIRLTGWKTALSATNGGHLGTLAAGNYTFVQPAMNGFTPASAEAYSRMSGNGNEPLVAAVGYELEMIQTSELKGELTQDSAVFETEPKEITDLNIYYEMSGYIPITLDSDSIKLILPVGSTINHISQNASNPGVPLSASTEIIESGTLLNDNEIVLSNQFTGLSPGQTLNISSAGGHVDVGDILEITRLDGTSFNVTIVGFGDSVGGGGQLYNSILIDPFLYNNKYTTNWHNCYSFGNGVESNRIRDSFNLSYILNGVKASTTLEEGKYEREHRKYGLIYSGLYNSISGVNNLNQFIQAEKITKDINPIYGSIQKLHARDTDLITLCEDKTLRILANKDAVYEADGNSQLTTTNRVLGQVVPFSGEFGISKNPESFASENYRVYFTDKQRGAVMRLSKDGLTPISNHGMKDWFRDNLKLSDKLVGSYDDRNDEYNITLGYPVQKTVSFKEDVKGWVSFKSFIPENAISCANNYFTIFQGILYKHYDESVDRNTFYSYYTDSSLNVILNESPGSVKSFHTLGYEGSQSQITPLTLYNADSGIMLENEYYNLTAKDGWYVDSFVTDLENGSLDEFIEKEGKWFNYLHGESITTNFNGFVDSNYDTDSFAVQGIGYAYSTDCPGCTPCVDGCMDPDAQNYNPLATCDDGSCIPHIPGCIDSTATNYNPNATIDDGSCVYQALPSPNTPPAVISGCTNPLAINYNPNATVDDGSCAFGCCNASFDIYVDAGNGRLQLTLGPGSSCPGYGTAALLSVAAVVTITRPDGSHYIDTNGTTWHLNNVPISLTTNPQVLPFIDNAALLGQSGTWEAEVTYVFITTGQGGAIPPCTTTLTQNVTVGCMDPSSSTYNPSATVDDGSCCVDGCTDPSATNYDPNAGCDDGSCVYPIVYPSCNTVSNADFSSAILLNSPGEDLGSAMENELPVTTGWKSHNFFNGGAGNSIPPYIDVNDSLVLEGSNTIVSATAEQVGVYQRMPNLTYGQNYKVTIEIEKVTFGTGGSPLSVLYLGNTSATNSGTNGLLFTNMTPPPPFITYNDLFSIQTIIPMIPGTYTYTGTAIGNAPWDTEVLSVMLDTYDNSQVKIGYICVESVTN